MTRHHSCRVSPFGHPRINARLATPRGLSQPPTSFIGSQCQGIHHAPLNTYNTNYKNQLEKKLHHNKPHTRQPQKATRQHVRLDARNHYPQIKHHTPPPRWSDNTPPDPQTENNGPVVSGPNSVSGSIDSHDPVEPITFACRAPTDSPLQTAGTHIPTTASHRRGGGGTLTGIRCSLERR